MVKKIKFYLQLNNIFLNPAWLKYKILPSVKTGAIFQSSTYIVKKTILPSVKIDAFSKLNMV